MCDLGAMSWPYQSIVIVIKGVAVSQSFTSGRISRAATEWVVDEPVVGLQDSGKHHCWVGTLGDVQFGRYELVGKAYCGITARGCV